MSPEEQLIEKLTKLNHIAETLNRSVDTQSMLQDVLADLVQLMDLEAGWILLKRAGAGEDSNLGYTLAAHHNLPPALDPGDAETWRPGCACQLRQAEVGADEAYNVIECSRLGHARGDRRGLAVHASAALRAGERILGILNVAAPDWSAFSPQALALLTNVGSQIGTALERARLFDLLKEQRVYEQALLLDFSNQLLGRLDLDDLIGYLVEQVRRALQADASALLLAGEEAGFLDFRATSGWLADPVGAHRQIQAGGEVGPARAMRTLEPELVGDLEQSDLAPFLPAWLRAEGFHGYAVVPLVVEGRSIGLLTVQDRRPRTLDENGVRLLRLMANQAAIAIEKARLHREELRGRAMEREMELGREIQLGLLPTGAPVIPGWEFAVHYQPARLVGGDYYDLIEFADAPGRLGIVIADVVGKGVPAALFMALGRTVIRAMATGSRSPAEVLVGANPVILKDSHSGLFLTAFYALLDTATGRLTYANAGHNRPLLWRAATGEIHELVSDGIALGAVPGIELEERAIDMAPGDLVLLYTDGVTEAMDGEYRPFGMERLRAALHGCAGAPAQETVDTLAGDLKAFAGDVQRSDDITVLAARRLA
ncbi:MAG TPA: SpoIIE family protein phosphatase [Anaerolineae bacterium]|nr:SpoIIE family protein phosphatase [Anaerolineae bacterium]